MHLVPAPGWDAPGTRLPSTDIHQRGEPRLTGKLHLLTCSKAESRWGKGVLQLHIKGEAGRPQRHCRVLTRQGTGLCPRCFRKDHGSQGLECGTKPVSLKHHWAGEAALGPGVPPGTQRLLTFPAKGDVSSERELLLLSMVFQSREARAEVGGVAQWIEHLPSPGFHLSTV